MTKFILIDHSLRSVGGHHYEYAVHILREAERAGHEVVLATHRDFRGQSALPQTWRVLPLFHDDVYTNFAILAANKCRQNHADLNSMEALLASALVSWNPTHWLSKCRNLFRYLGFHHRSQRFAGACQQLHRSVQPRPGDLIFAATVSVFDLNGLTSFLADYPETESLSWHLQFHHAFLDGREADYDAQTDMLQAMRKICQQALARVPRHRLCFHTTTHHLARQYNRLKVGTFTELPYPVNPRFYRPDAPHTPNRSTNVPSISRPADNSAIGAGRQDREEPRPARCLNITCAGGMRREKGSRQMAALVRQLWDPYLSTGRVRLHIQASRRSFLKVSLQQRQLPSGSHIEPLVRVPHPLGMDDYVRLIHATDLGLFFYDSRIYYARCSGILAEMLAAGVPVIVPAGCWLADQIAEPIFGYLDSIHQQFAPVQILRPADIKWNRLVANDEIVLGPRRAELQGELHVPKDTTGLMVRFRHPATADEGHYVRVSFSERTERGQCVDEQVMVVGARQQAELPVSVYMVLNEATARVRLSLQDAYGGGGIEISDLQCSFLATRNSQERSLPLSAVGVIAADLSQIPRLLAETTDHFDHYRRTAQLFSHEWMTRHSPPATFATLTARHANTEGRDQPVRAA